MEELREAQARADATALRAQETLREATQRLARLKDDVSSTHKKAAQSQKAAEKAAQQRDAKASDVPSLERAAAEAKREAMRCRQKEHECVREV